MTALLELYPHWLLQEMDLGTPNISLLLLMCPDKSDLNKRNLAKGKTEGVPMMRNEGQFENVDLEINRINAFVPEDIMFGNFVEGVMNGDINVDAIPAFRQHMQQDWEESVLSWGNVANLEEFKDYKPPDIFADESSLETADRTGKPKKSHEKKSVTQKHCQKLTKLMSEVFTMKGTEGIEQKFTDENITKNDLKEAVMDCLENELVAKVVLKSQKTVEHWTDKWDDDKPFKTPELAKKLQVMVLRQAKSTTPKKRKRTDADGDQTEEE